jgi:predicted dithiol-disulfide oxidoreductase (DUF899 family)
VKKDYVFEGPTGKETLADLFGGKSQLMIYHFMLGPGWAEGCQSCSLLADHFDGSVAHLAARDTRLVVVSRAPLAEIGRFKMRMGWRFKWVSSYRSDFNYDFHVSFQPDDIEKGEVYYNYEMRRVDIEELSGRSVFYKDENGDLFHTYSSYGRGGDLMLGTYNILDLMPKGRNETGPNHNLTDWVRHHDRYDSGAYVASTGRYVPADGSAGK